LKQEEIKFLGLYITLAGVKIDEVKVFMEWPVPKKVKNVQRFLGLANFYRHFVENFSKIAMPMNKLL